MTRAVEMPQDLVTRSRTWFLGFLCPSAENATWTDVNLLQALLGVWLCEQASQFSKPSVALRRLAASVRNWLGRKARRRTFDPYEHDPMLLLLTHHVLTACNCRLDTITRFSKAMANTLPQLDSLPLSLTAVAALLSKKRLLQHHCTPILDIGDVGRSAGDLLRADEDKIRVICDNIAQATQFGRHPLKATTQARSIVSRVLPVILLESLRRYKLEFGALVLRTIGYSHLPCDKHIRLAIQFLIDQQQSDGRFGYLAIESAHIGRSTGLSQVQIDRRLCLPVTLACLWSLVEALAPKFNLFAAVGL